MEHMLLNESLSSWIALAEREGMSREQQSIMPTLQNHIAHVDETLQSSNEWVQRRKIYSWAVIYSKSTFHYQSVAVVEWTLIIEISVVTAVTTKSVIAETNTPERSQIYVQE